MYPPTSRAFGGFLNEGATMPKKPTTYIVVRGMPDNKIDYHFFTDVEELKAKLGEIAKSEDGDTLLIKGGEVTPWKADTVEIGEKKTRKKRLKESDKARP